MSSALMVRLVRGNRDRANLSLVVLVLLRRYVNVVVAEGKEFTFHSIDRAQAVHLQVLHEVDIVPDYVFPELRREQSRCEYQGFPVVVSDFDLAGEHYEFEVDEADDDALGSQLHHVHHVPDEPHDVFLLRMALLVGDLGEVEIEDWQRARVTIRRLDVPLVRHEVVLVEKLGALRGNWDQSLRLANVAEDDVADVGVQLLPRQLQAFVGLELFLPQTGKSVDFLLSKLHELSLLLRITFFFRRLAVPVGLVRLVADHVEFILSRFFRSLFELLGLRYLLFLRVSWAPP